MLIPLTKGKFAIIDDEDFDLINEYKWNCSHYGYAVTRGGTKMHRLIMRVLGKNEILIDHINGDGLDNRKCNLRFCNQHQNIANGKMRKSNTSGYKGVYWDKERNRWMATIKFHRKTFQLGRFLSKEAAAKAYDYKAIELFGEFAKTNTSMGLL